MDMDNLAAELMSCSTREQGHALIAPLTVAELRQLARHPELDVRGIGSRATKSQLRSKIVYLVIGVRLDSRAILGHARGY